MKLGLISFVRTPLIGMMLQSLPPVSLFDVFRRGRGVQTQDIIELHFKRILKSCQFSGFLKISLENRRKFASKAYF
jgi:hypothetical protein